MNKRLRPLLWVFLLPLLLLASPRLTLAAPVEPTPVQLIQPDSDPFEAQPFGDEWYNGYEHNNFTILQTEDGSWVYAIPAADGSLVASTTRVSSGRTPPAGATPHLRDRVELAQIPHVNRRFAPEASGGALGVQPVLILLVDFTPSVSLGTTAAEWSNAFFDDTAGAKSVANFYTEASFGKFTVEPVAETQGTANDGVVAVTLDYAHPDTRGDTDSANRLLTRDALLAADAFIDFSVYDLNNNGSLDVTELHLLVIPRGYETSFGGAGAACAPSVWGHRWVLDIPEAPQMDSVKVGDYSQGGGYMQFGEWQDTSGGVGCPGTTEGNRATIGIMVHELGHDINWPDLYDIDQTTSGIGYWSVMASGSWGRAAGEPAGTTPSLPDPFSKIYQTWVTPQVISGVQAGLSIENSAETPTVYQLGANPNGVDWNFNNSSGSGEYFLVENRQQVGFDTGLNRISSSASGLLIWHITESVPYTNFANADEARRLIDVVEANPTQDMEISSNRGDRDDVWPGSNNYTTFGPTTTPSSDWHDDVASGIVIENINATARGAISADFTVPTNTPTSVAFIGDGVSAESTALSLFCISLLLIAATLLSKKRSLKR